VSLRIAPQMHAQLLTSAMRNDRSYSAEIEARLGYSFRCQEALSEALAVAFGTEGGKLLLLLGRLIRYAPGVTRKDFDDDWTKDPTAWSVAERGIVQALKRLRPPGDPLPGGEPPEHRADRMLVALELIKPPPEWASEEPEE
jgi:hypothetical protein